MPENTTPPEVDQLRRQVEELQQQLARVRAERDEYKKAAYEMLEKLHPYTPPSEEELHDLLHGPRGRPLLEILAEAERELGARTEPPDGHQ